MKSIAAQFVFALAAFCLVGNSNASILAVVDSGGNDDDALAWLVSQGYIDDADDLLLIAKDETQSGNGLDDGELISVGGNMWDHSEDGTAGESRSGEWSYAADAGFTPLFWFLKFDSLIAVYSYMGTTDFGDSYDLDAQFFDTDADSSWQEGDDLELPIVDTDNNVLINTDGEIITEPEKNVKPHADLSHLSVYGTMAPPPNPQGFVPEPAAFLVWFGLLTTMTFASRRTR